MLLLAINYNASRIVIAILKICVDMYRKLYSTCFTEHEISDDAGAGMFFY